MFHLNLDSAELEVVAFALESYLREAEENAVRNVGLPLNVVNVRHATTTKELLEKVERMQVEGE